MNRQLTKVLYENLVEYIKIFNNIMIGDSRKKYPIRIKELNQLKKSKWCLSKLDWVDKTINFSSYEKMLLEDNYNFEPLQNKFSDFDFTKIKKLAVNVFLDRHTGIMKYYSEFIEFFYQNPRIIDKNNILDALLLTNYDDVIVLTLDNLYLDIMNRFNPKHASKIKELVRV